MYIYTYMRIHIYIYSYANYVDACTRDSAFASTARFSDRSFASGVTCGARKVAEGCALRFAIRGAGKTLARICLYGNFAREKIIDF